MGRYWVNIDISKVKVAYPFVLKLLVELADTLSSVEFRKFESKFKSVCPFMAHTLISYIFDLFRQFVKLAQNPHVIRRVKASNIIPLEYIETVLLMHVDLLYQLKLFVAIGSVQHLFATAPLTVSTFCSGMARWLFISCVLSLSFSIPITCSSNSFCIRFRQDNHKDKGEHGRSSNSGGRGAEGNGRDNIGDRAGRGNKRKADDQRGGNQREHNIASIEGCIVNRIGRNIIFPSSLSQKYSSHFADTDKLCTFEEWCKHSHASFPDGYTAQAISSVLNFVKKTQGLGWHGIIKVPFQ